MKFGKRGSLEWDQLGKWIIGLAVLIVVILIILMISGKMDISPLKNMRFG